MTDTTDTGVNQTSTNTSINTTPTTSTTTTTPSIVPSHPHPQQQTCLSAIGPIPIINSSPALLTLASQLHSLTTPLPTIQSQTMLTQCQDLVDDSLARMDEWSEILDEIKYTTNQTHTQLMPEVIRKQANLQNLFQQVHTFAKYAQELDRYVTYVESRVDQVDLILKRTDHMEAEYAKNKATIAASRNGVNDELRQVEQAASKLWSSFKVRTEPTRNLGKSSSSSSPSTAAAATAFSSPTMLDLVDAFTPFEAPPDFHEFFVAFCHLQQPPHSQPHPPQSKPNMFEH